MARANQASAAWLPHFFLLTFALTWTCFISFAAMTQRSPEAGALRIVILYVGIFAPALVAISLTAWTEGADGVATLLRGLFLWQVKLRWYLFAIGYMAAIKLGVALVYRIGFGDWPRFGEEPWYLILAATFGSAMVGGQAGEEIGWRGYALPRLAARFGIRSASLLLGILWACWHLPLFFVEGADTMGQSFVVYAVEVTAISVAVAWLYVRTGGSLLLTMLMHSAINQSKNIVPSVLPQAGNVFTLHASPIAWITAALLWACAAIFIGRGLD